MGVSALFAYKMWTKQQDVDYPQGVEDELYQESKNEKNS